MNGTKAVHPGVTTALFSACNSPGGGGEPAEPRPPSASNFGSNVKPGILASNPASLRALACHSAPLRFKPVCIECNMWGCYVKTVDPPLECCGICPPCTSCSLELCDSTCAYSVWGWNKNRITFSCTVITKTWMWFGHMGFSYCGGAI